MSNYHIDIPYNTDLIWNTIQCQVVWDSYFNKPSFGDGIWDFVRGSKYGIYADVFNLEMSNVKKALLDW